MSSTFNFLVFSYERIIVAYINSSCSSSSSFSSEYVEWTRLRYGDSSSLMISLKHFKRRIEYCGKIIVSSKVFGSIITSIQPVSSSLLQIKLALEDNVFCRITSSGKFSKSSFSYSKESRLFSFSFKAFRKSDFDIMVSSLSSRLNKISKLSM